MEYGRDFAVLYGTYLFVDSDSTNQDKLLGAEAQAIESATGIDFAERTPNINPEEFALTAAKAGLAHEIFERCLNDCKKYANQKQIPLKTYIILYNQLTTAANIVEMPLSERMALIRLKHIFDLWQCIHHYDGGDSSINQADFATQIKPTPAPVLYPFNSMRQRIITFNLSQNQEQG